MDDIVSMVERLLERRAELQEETREWKVWLISLTEAQRASYAAEMEEFAARINLSLPLNADHQQPDWSVGSLQRKAICYYALAAWDERQIECLLREDEAPA